MPFILARKLQMDQEWKEGKVVPVTVVEALPNKVTLLRTEERDGYRAVQVALGATKREFRVAQLPELKEGDTISVTAFQENDRVLITGTSKGKGFQGVVKRHGFGGGPKTHGQKDRLRAPGSIGATTPQRVIPGKKMAGRTGGEKVTRKTLVVGVDKERNLLFLKGAVPGARGSLVIIRTLE
ncbi:50S ribosomal protein L3 [Candidatus Parcubacteria bacterium]|nr:MAG: 50S ribosomal protein L3 [Candidatus Parcubacteria bacterium]